MSFNFLKKPEQAYVAAAIIPNTYFNPSHVVDKTLETPDFSDAEIAGPRPVSCCNWGMPVSSAIYTSIVLSTKSVQQIYLPGATRILKKRCSQGCVPRTRGLSAPGTLEGRSGTMSAAYTPLHVTVAREMLRHGSVVYNTHKTQ